MPRGYSKCMVQDMTLYDDQCPSAVLGLKNPGVQESRSVSYAGVAWNSPERRKDITAATRARQDVHLQCMHKVHCP